jgi:hypothetical protein
MELVMPQIAQSIAAEFISVWDQSTQVKTNCLIDPASGVLTLIEKADEEELFVQTLDSQHVLFDGMAYSVTEADNGTFSINNLVGLQAGLCMAATFPEIPAYLIDKSFIKLAGNPAANTALAYMYRDGGNIKTTEVVIFPGAISIAQLKIIEDNLLRDEGDNDFLPRQVDLSPLCPDVDDDSYDEDIDHCVHTILEIELTLKAPDDQTPITDFVNKFAAIGPEGWDMVNFGNSTS